MIFIHAFIILVLCFMIFVQSRWIWNLNRARRKGLWPLTGQITMFDVRRALIEGEEELAVALYRRLYSVSRNKAAQAVNELNESIRQKKTRSE